MLLGTLKSATEEDLYSFTGHAGDLMNLTLNSVMLPYFTAPFDTKIYLYNASGPGGTPGSLIAANDNEFESSDSIIIDFTLPADGTYYVGVASGDGQGFGNYELFMYSFKALPAGSVVAGSGNTLIGGSGQTTFIDSSGDDQMSFLPGSTGTATVIGGSGNNTINANNDPGISLIASGRVGVNAATYLNSEFIYQVTGSRTALDNTLTFSLEPDTDSSLSYPTGARIDPATGVLTWTPTVPGTYAVRILTTQSSGGTEYQDLTINVEGSEATTTTVQSSNSSAVFGQSVTFTATVTANQQGLSQTPTGTVTFFDNGVAIGTGTLQIVSGQDQATLATTALPVGTNSITAAYTSGDTIFQASPPATPSSQVINPASTTTSITSSVNPSVSGQAVTFTALVGDSTPGSRPSSVPTGAVTFYDGGSPIGTGTLQVINGVDQASFTTATLSTTAHTVTAAYTSGDANFQASPESSAFSQQVNHASTTTTVVTSTATSVSGQLVTFTATVVVTGPGSTAMASPTGTVTFYDSGAVIGAGNVSTSTGGVTTASFSTSSLSTASHTITAAYTSGDANFSASPASAGITQTVQQANTSVAVVSSAEPSVSGQSVTFTATVTVDAPGSTFVAQPTGTITFYDDGQVLGTAALQVVSGADQARFSSNQLNTGSHTITAAYASGDADFNPVASSPPVTQIVNRASTTTTVTSSSVNNTSVSGQAVTLTATVAVGTPGSTSVAFPTGTVTFLDGSVAISPPEPLSTSGGVTTATFTTGTLSTASHSIVAVYNDDENFVGSPSAVITQTVNRASTATTVSSSAATSAFGQTVTFTATIGLVRPATTAVAAPTGSVVFYDHGAAISPAVPLITTNGVTSASFAAATLSVGLHSITAVYSDDANFAPSSTTSPLAQTVNKASTTTTIVSSANPSVSGQSVMFTAQVTVNNPGSQAAANPTGTVTFYDGGVAIGTGTLSNTATDTATFTTRSLSTTTHSITAAFSGDGNFSASGMSAALQQVVSPANTTTTVSSSGGPTVSGQAVTFTAVIAVASPGSTTVAVPTGTATFYDNGQAIGTASLSTSGGVTTAVFTTRTLSTAMHTITAAYTSGDANFNGSKSLTLLTQMVNKANTTTLVVSSANPSVQSQNVTFTATVTVNTPGSQAFANPTGTVTFYAGGIWIGTGMLSNAATDIATFTTNALPAGTTTITAAYTSGDSNFNASPVSQPISQVVASVFVMNPTSSGALTVSGSGNITIPGPLEIESNAKTALVASGNAVVKAPVINIVGGDSISGKASVSTPLNTGVPASSIVDPLAGLAVPTLTGSLQAAVNVSGSSRLTINPGIYSGITVSGNGSLTMTAGIYVIAGGGFTVSGQASVTAAGVMIYNAGNNYVTPGGTTFGAVNLSGNGTITMTGPTSGTYAGIAIFQSRDNSKGVTVSGNSSAGIAGLIYALNASVTLSGNAELVDGLVAGTLNVSGNSVFNAQDGTTGYTPGQIRTAYGINALDSGLSTPLDGTGQTIAIVDAYDNPAIFQSLDTFDEQFGMTDSGPTLYQQYGPASSFLTVLNQAGQAAPLPSTDPTGPGIANWEMEEALDVEWVHAIAPAPRSCSSKPAANRLPISCNSVATAANQPGVSVVSMSWGFTEGQNALAADEAMYDQYLTTPAGHQGVTFVASAGDYGAADPHTPPSRPTCWPSAARLSRSMPITRITARRAGDIIRSRWARSSARAEASASTKPNRPIN